MIEELSQIGGCYYYEETGFYYVSSRYYDPETGRFISADTTAVLTATPMSLTDKNLFAYCDNNPITRIDTTGEFWETVFDVVSLGMSIMDVIENPEDPMNWLCLAMDTIDLIPFVTGAGEITRAVKILNKTDFASDSLKIVDCINYTKKVQKQMDNADDLYHAFPTLVDTMLEPTDARYIVGGDGEIRRIFELSGSLNDQVGIFEYIIEIDGKCNHRFFKAIK